MCVCRSDEVLRIKAQGKSVRCTNSYRAVSQSTKQIVEVVLILLFSGGSSSILVSSIINLQDHRVNICCLRNKDPVLQVSHLLTCPHLRW